MTLARAWYLRSRPVGAVTPDNLELRETEIGELQPGEVLLRMIYLSLDPTNRIWMSDQDQYMPPVEIGAPMRGGGMAVVEPPEKARQ